MPQYRPYLGASERAASDPDEAAMTERAASDPDEAAMKSTVLRLLLQEHASAQTSLLIHDVLGRLMSAGLVVYFGLIAELSTPQLISGILAAAMVATFWQWGRRRATRRILGVEETLSRMSGGSVEQAYIESRFIGESRGSTSMVLRLEPGIWFYVSMTIILVSVIVSGVTS